MDLLKLRLVQSIYDFLFEQIPVILFSFSLFFVYIGLII